MSKAAAGVAARAGFTPETNPWACLLLGYVAFGLPRIAEEIRLTRLAYIEAQRRKGEASA